MVRNLVCFGSLWFEHPTKITTFQTVGPEICSVLIFYKRVWDYLAKHTRKIFLMLYSINSSNWVTLLHEILDNICIAVVCFSGYDIMNFEINLIFLIMTKKLRQKLKYLENKNSFLRWIKKYFPSFLKDFQLSKIVSDLRVCY